MSDKIIEYALYGEHIPLKCKNHPDKRWSTKNISYIGARSVFYDSFFHPSIGPECICPIGDLIPLTAEEAEEERE